MSGIDRIEIISASAGSGKTTRLAAELQKAVTSGGVGPDSILATTFTRKAAAELLERGRTALLVAGRLEEAERFGAARIGTVNSVCGRLVADFAFELGISPDLEVLDEKRAAEAFKRCLSEVVAKEEQARLTEISQRFYEFEWQDSVKRVVDLARTNGLTADDLHGAKEASATSFSQLLGTPSGTANEIDDALVTALEKFIAGVEQNQKSGADMTKGTSEALDEARRSLHDMRGLGFQEWRRWVKLSRLKTTKKSQDLLPPLHAAAERVHEHPLLVEDGTVAIRLVYELAARSLIAYQEYKRERRSLDFVDQETLALKLLVMPGVKETLKETIRLVLVDEFQDTSPIQLALFLHLADVAEKSIWVGDQKQAIYGFRGTDPALMDAAVGVILKGNEPTTLSKSWRSRPELVELTSALFVKSFAHHGLPESRVRLSPGKTEEPEGLGHIVERWTLKAKNQEEDAKALAAAVRGFLGDTSVRVRDRETGQCRNHRVSDVAILCRRHKNCALVAAELAALGIAAVMPRTGLLATMEGRVLFAGLRLWSDPRDALASAELGRYLTYPDQPDAWLQVALEKPQAEGFRQIPEVAALLLARQATPQAGPLAAIDIVMRMLDMRELCARWGEDRQRLANLDAFRAHVIAFTERSEDDGISTTVAALIGHLYQLEQDAEDSQAVVGSDDAVTIATWHAAKGLEWPITVLFQLDTDPIVAALGVHVDSESEQLDLSDPLKGRWVRYWPNPFHPSQKDTPFHQRMAQTSAAVTAEAKERSQELRLLYVGWTRARDRVVLAGRGSLTHGILSFLRDEERPLLDAPKPDGSQEETTAEWAGRSITFKERLFSPEAGQSAEPTAGWGFVLPLPNEFSPAYLAPSDIDISGEASTPFTIGEALPLPGAVDMQHLGNALHGFFGADLEGLAHHDRLDIAAGLLARWQVEDVMTPEAVLAAADRLRAFVNDKWSYCVWHREWPIEYVTGDGTTIRGSADLVLETSDGFVIIDHKSFPGLGDAALERAKTYAGQLAAYAGAVSAARRRPILGTYVHLPVAGLIVPVSTKQV